MKKEKLLKMDSELIENQKSISDIKLKNSQKR